MTAGEMLSRAAAGMGSPSPSSGFKDTKSWNASGVSIRLYTLCTRRWQERVGRIPGCVKSHHCFAIVVRLSRFAGEQPLRRQHVEVQLLPLRLQLADVVLLIRVTEVLGDLPAGTRPARVVSPIVIVE